MKRLIVIAWTALLLVVFASSRLALAADKPNEHIGQEFGEYRHAAGKQVGVAPSDGRDPALLDLAGPWKCDLDPQDIGVAEQWFAREMQRPIRLPGTLDEAGYGEKNDEKTIRWLNRRVRHVGPAWYQRQVDIPSSWQGKRITLLLERCMWESRVWIDEQPIGAADSLFTPHVYELTEKLTPGRHRLTIRVDNRGRPGANSHGYGDDEQIRWNGLLGRMELVASDVVSIESVQVFPEPANRRAIVRVEARNITPESYDGVVAVSARLKGRADSPWSPPAKTGFKIASGGLPVEVVLPLSESMALWDEFSPNLYELQVELSAEARGKKAFDRRVAAFGMRELSHHGTQLVVNGRTVMLRGTHDGGGFPLTGHPAMDAEAWRRIFRICKSYGLNHVRYHSFCPPEAAFAAADEEGIYLLAELPFWGDVGPEWPGTAFLRAELRRILDAYGNHPSFCMMSMGNEHSGDWDVLGRFVAEAKRHDPRRLYAAASNEYIRMDKDAQPTNPGDDFAVIMLGPKGEAGFERGRIRYMERLIHGEPPAFDADYREILRGFDVPTFAHELGQWWIFPDVREAAKYRGVLRSVAMERFRDSLEQAGQMGRMEQFHQASAALAVRLYKEDIERELRTPGLGGFQLLDLHDYTGQNTSLVGLLDAFWETKGAVPPEEFRRFCSPTVPLARLPKVVWSNRETLQAGIEVAHYGPADLSDLTPTWKLTDRRGAIVAGGTLPKQTRIPTGQSTTLGAITTPLAAVAQAEQLTLEARLGDTANAWTLWVYPAQPAAEPVPENIRTAENLDAQTLQFLAAGGRVLLLAHNSPHTVPTDFPNPVWNPWIGGSLTSCGLLIAAAHPALAEFPTASHSDWQWRDLLEPEARTFVLNELPNDTELIAETIDEPLRAFRLGVLWEARVEKSVLVATSLDLVNDLEQRLSAAQLRRSLLTYLASDRCRPALELSAQQAQRIIGGSRIRPVREVPSKARTMLDVAPSVFAPAEACSSWKASYDRVQAEQGFGYSIPPARFDPWKNVPRVSWLKEGHPAWMATDFTIRVQCPPDFQGTLYLHFQDLDSGKSSGVLQVGRDACYIGPHTGEGKWVAVQVAPEDMQDGQLDLRLYKPAGGDGWSRAPRITRLMVVE